MYEDPPTRVETCESCQGAGFDVPFRGGDPEWCLTCGGIGEYKVFGDSMDEEETDSEPATGDGEYSFEVERRVWLNVVIRAGSREEAEDELSSFMFDMVTGPGPLGSEHVVSFECTGDDFDILLDESHEGGDEGEE